MYKFHPDEFNAKKDRKKRNNITRESYSCIPRSTDICSCINRQAATIMGKEFYRQECRPDVPEEAKKPEKVWMTVLKETVVHGKIWACTEGWMGARVDEM